MFHFQILTLFPELFSSFSALGLIGRARQEQHIKLDTIYLRDFAINPHGQVDDTPYGGGSGMILRLESAVAAMEQAKEKDPKAKIVLFSPRGKAFTQSTAQGFVDHHQETSGGLVLLCGRYEGVDERVATHYVDYELSLGDFVLMGGEIPAMAVIETVSRLLPSVLGNPESLATESFQTHFLEYPQYTKPQVFRGYEVPPVLLSGHHQEIDEWRKKQALQDTLQRRPDLLQKAFHQKLVASGLQVEISLALMHHPVLDKQEKIITSSVTNIDLHDISRSAKTFGIKRFYVSHPVKALRRLSEKICEHWETGYGATYNPNRSEALEIISLTVDFDDILFDIEARTGRLPKVVTTSARKTPHSISFTQLQGLLLTAEDPYLLVLGTGWGLAPELLSRADYHLEPILGPTPYNHLSVRAAAAIILDRLFGV